jgi:hypothetical protein
MAVEDRVCPFKGECVRQCALYIGGSETTKGECALTTMAQHLKSLNSKVQNIVNKT